MVHAVNILLRILHTFVLASDLVFFRPFVAVFGPLLFEGSVSTVKNKGFLNVANIDFQNTRFATLSRRFRVSLQFRAHEEDFTL